MLIERCYIYRRNGSVFVCLMSRIGLSISIHLARARQLLDTEVGAHLLGTSGVRIGQVLCIDTEAVSGVTDAVAL